MTKSLPCILCGEANTAHFAYISKKNYQRCMNCDLVFLDPSQRLDSLAEKARYEKHENNVLDLGYQKFVRPLFEAVIEFYPKTSIGLDYGSGPEATGDSAVSYLLSQNGYNLKKFDPLFLNDLSVLTAHTYDYILVCEVAEHFYAPAEEFSKLKSYLKPGGALFVMTSLLTPDIDFVNWSYRRDVTHVCFYTSQTAAFLQDRFQFKSAEIRSNQIIILKN